MAVSGNVDHEFVDELCKLADEFINEELYANPFMKPPVCGTNCIHKMEYDEKVTELRRKYYGEIG